MTDRRETLIARWPALDSSGREGLAELLTAYHLRTEAEKGAAVADAAGLPERYRAEILDPRTAFADAAVLVASSGDELIGCVVVIPAEGRAEIKRLWVDPAMRGRGVATALLRAALKHAGENGARTVRLSVWHWRTDAVAVYQRMGFAVVEPWEARDGLVCMERAA